MSYPQFERLVKTIAKLRHPTDGCPWDLKQTHQSLLKYLIEEAYEFVTATENNSPAEMEDELGDVLLQVVLHAQLGSEQGHFTIESVAKNLADKMERRHPHVFGAIENNITPEQVKENWAEIKKTEKKPEKNGEKKVDTKIEKSVLNFPALFSANKIGEKTNRFGFDWPDAKAVEEVVHSEWKEFKDELDAVKPNQQKIQEEFGDLLFSLAQLGRHLNINPEIALQQANKKFLKRFHAMETLISNDGLKIDDMNQNEMDVFWKKVKEQEHD